MLLTTNHSAAESHFLFHLSFEFRLPSPRRLNLLAPLYLSRSFILQLSPELSEWDSVWNIYTQSNQAEPDYANELQSSGSYFWKLFPHVTFLRNNLMLSITSPSEVSSRTGISFYEYFKHTAMNILSGVLPWTPLARRDIDSSACETSSTSICHQAGDDLQAAKVFSLISN